MKFKKQLLNQSELGEIFGVTSHEMGRWLTDLGLRCDAKRTVTRKAIDGGYCKIASAQLSYTNYGWVPDAVVAALVCVGRKPLMPPPSHLVMNAPLTPHLQLQKPTL